MLRDVGVLYHVSVKEYESLYIFAMDSSAILNIFFSHPEWSREFLTLHAFTTSFHYQII